MKDKTYETFRILSVLIIHVATLVTAVGGAIGIPHTEIIVACLAALGTFCGSIAESARNGWKSKFPELYQNPEEEK